MSPASPVFHHVLFPYTVFDDPHRVVTELSDIMLSKSNRISVASMNCGVNCEALVPVTAPMQIEVEVCKLVSEAIGEDIRHIPKCNGGIWEPVPAIVHSAVPAIVPRTRFTPKKPDSLFWSVYVAQYGVSDFLQIGTKYMNRELEEKQKIGTYLREHRADAKRIKLSLNTIEEIRGDLLTNQTTGFLVLPALALYYQADLWIVYENTYTIFPCGNEGEPRPVHLLYRTKGAKYASYTVDIQEPADIAITQDHIRETHVYIEHPHKPFKSISNYKLELLEEIAFKLQVESDPKWKKNRMYEAVVTRCTWIGEN